MTVVVNFDVRCPARVIGVVTPIDLWADHPAASAVIEAAVGRRPTSRAADAAERRLCLAEYCIGAGVLDRTLSFVRPTRFRLVGRFEFDVKRMSSFDAAPAVAGLVDWTLRNVYGHPYAPYGGKTPVSDVRVRLWQPRARSADRTTETP